MLIAKALLVGMQHLEEMRFLLPHTIVWGSACIDHI